MRLIVKNIAQLFTNSRIIPGITLGLALALILGGCASTPYKNSQITTLPPDMIYSQGKDALSNDNYKAAILHFKSLEIYYPGDPHSVQAQLELAFAYQKSGDHASAIATANRFISNEPDHPNVDYAYYLKGLVHFEKAINSAEAGEFELVKTMPLSAQLSMQNFSELMTKFPNSKYNHDARQRSEYLHDFLAQQEINLAKQYIDQEQYAEAALHSKNIIENFPDSASVTEAATLTNIAYEMLGITATSNKEAKTSMDTSETGAMADEAATPMMNEGMHNILPPATANMSESPEKTAQINKEWLLTQNLQHFTIQLLATSNEEALIEYIERNQIADSAVYTQQSINGKSWFTLFYGKYPTKNQASEQINEFPDDMKKVRPWVRQFDDILADISN